jgi:hypothetical protein
MTSSEALGRPPLGQPVGVVGEATQSAVSWGAIFAGSVAAIAITIILMVLGSGIGLSMISPWYRTGASVTTVGVSAVVGLVIVQWISSGVGGFLAGRLRTKWTGVHGHEVFFRDTAHGFLAWSVASVAGALMIAGVTASGVSGVARGTTDVAATAAAGAASAGANHGGAHSGNPGSEYFVDTMFRSANPTDGDKASAGAETARILAQSTHDGQVGLSAGDKAYLAQLVAAKTGIAQPDAEQRVDSVIAQVNDASLKARQAADTARKRAAQLSIVTALAMLIGAFIASAAAALGGNIREEY